MRHGLAVAGLLCAVATSCGGHGRDPGTIVFQSDRSGQDGSYAVRPNGSRLTRLGPQESFGVWTRDGTKVLVMDTMCDSCPIVFEPARHKRRNFRLQSVQQISDMPWSPDGKRLVVETAEGDFVLDVATGMRQPLGDGRPDDYLTWSPDGKGLLFSSGSDIFVAPADGGPRTELFRLPGKHELRRLRWSSDGKWISFTESGKFYDELYVVRSDGSGRRLIARGPQSDPESAAWSPTGERIGFSGSSGIFVVDLEQGSPRRLTRAPVEIPAEQGPIWSPDGKRILYGRNDLGFGAASGYHTQLWTMKADGSDQRPLTHAFPGDGSTSSPQWIAGTLTGTPVPRLPLVSLRASSTLVTKLPITGLGAEGTRAAVAQGFGGTPSFHGPLGPIIVWNSVRNSTRQIPVRGCGAVVDVLLVGGVVGYRCNTAFEGYTVYDALSLGPRKLVRTHGEEFNGTFLGGLYAEGGTIAFDVESAGNNPKRGVFRIHQTWIWKSKGARKALVRTFPGEATVASLDAGRIAVLRGQHVVSILSPGGGIRTFTFGRPKILGAALDGERLVVLQRRRLIIHDLGNSSRTTWPIRRGLGPEPYLQDVEGGLAAYVAGVAIHVLRLSDAREVVIDLPNATEPVFARLVPSGLFYSYNESYDSRPGRLVFVTRSELKRALASTAAAP